MISKERLLNRIHTRSTVDIEAIPEDMPVRGNAIVSGDDAYDKEVEDKILADLEWNQWVWCVVKVTVSYADISESEYLGGCSYKDESEFKEGGYYDDMVASCEERLANRLIGIHNFVESASE